jgi:predicted DsbA family dithiol-disulfide isomerase
MATISVAHYTDPGCPFAFSAEPRLLKLQWRYGDQLEWSTHMIVLSESVEEYEKKGLTPELLQRGAAHLRDLWGMPIDDTLRPRMHATAPACRAFVAARQYAPEKAEALLRRLRVLTMGGGLLDDPALIAQAATEAGIDNTDLDAWVRDPDVEIALRADMAATRDPHPAALAQKARLSPAGDGWRYSAPSLVFRDADGNTAAAPGFQPNESYEAVLANLDATLEQREAPTDVTEVLEWAPWPLASIEVAALLDVSIEDARTALSAVATETPVGQDGYWSLARDAATA